MKQDVDSELLTTRQVAKLSGLSVSAIHWFVRKNSAKSFNPNKGPPKIPNPSQRNGTFYFSKQEIIEWIEQRKVYPKTRSRIKKATVQG